MNNPFRRAIIFTGSLLLSTVSSTAQLRPSSKPNVLFILVDDLGYSDLGCTGSTFYETPNVDKLASRSFFFKQAYAACSVCSPSRASIMTGVYPTVHGVTDYLGAPEGEEWRKQNRFTKLLPARYKPELALSFTTIPELLKENGYATFFAGKWHLGPKGFFPEDQGFDVNKGGNHSGHPSRYFVPYNNPQLPDGPSGENLDMRLAKETTNFIQQHRSQPFFAFLAFYAVHSPLQTTERKWRYFRDKAEKQGIQDSGFRMERRMPARRQQDNPVYAGLIQSMDDAIGVVMSKLQELKLDKNTIIVFTSDNGGVVSGDNFSTNLFPLRGGKGYQWEGGLRVPLFIYVPGLGRKEVNVPVNGIDFLPTLLSLTGTSARPSQKIDGVSLAPLLHGQNIMARSLFWHYPHYSNQGGDPCSIMRQGKWKLIHYWEDDSNELYDLDADASEMKNVAAKDVDVTNRLWHQLRDWLQRTGALVPIKDPQYSSEKEADYRKKVQTQIWPRQEEIRKSQLSKDFKPSNDWWGSSVND